MMLLEFSIASLFFLAGSILAAPAPAGFTGIEKRQSVSILTPEEIDTFAPFTHFASTAYCQPANTLAWNCGSNCLANADFIPTASGGNGSTIQFWFVGYSPSQDSVIVAYQGTDTEEIAAIVSDITIGMTIMDSINFPGVPPTVRVHLGFYEAHARSASEVLSAVQQTIATHGARKVITVGHSLGGALALLNAIFLPLHISDIAVESVTYGMPRVGNKAFADYVDTHLELTHINNKKDIIPILPGIFLGFHHPSGELHIMQNDEWARCPGQDNPSTQCIVGSVPNIFVGDLSDHSGPYDGILMDC